MTDKYAKWLVKVAAIVHTKTGKNDEDVVQYIWIDPQRIAWVEARDTDTGPLATFVMDLSWPKGAPGGDGRLFTTHSLAEALTLIGAR